MENVPHGPPITGRVIDPQPQMLSFESIVSFEPDDASHRKLLNQGLRVGDILKETHFWEMWNSSFGHFKVKESLSSLLSLPRLYNSEGFPLNIFSLSFTWVYSCLGV